MLALEKEGVYPSRSTEETVIKPTTGFLRAFIICEVLFTA